VAGHFKIGKIVERSDGSVCPLPYTTVLRISSANN